MFRPCFALFALIVLTLAPVSQGFAETLVRVYVQAGSGGFSANGASDTALDLRKALQGKLRTLRVVDSANEADLIVRVDSRNERKQVSSVTTYENKSDDGKRASATTTPNSQTVKVLHGTLIAGDFQMPLQDESVLSWRLAASDMASDVDHWAKENYAKLLERRVEGRRDAATPERITQGPERITQGPERTTQAPEPTAPQSSSQTQTAAIEPGMTEAQVANAMGSPEKKVVFGKKSLWNYRGMQVVFENGRVTDVKF